MRRRFWRTLLILILLLTGVATALVYGPYVVWRSHSVRSWPTVGFGLAVIACRS